jgi:hypothetical protein
MIFVQVKDATKNGWNSKMWILSKLSKNFCCGKIFWFDQSWEEYWICMREGEGEGETERERERKRERERESLHVWAFEC